MIPCVDAEVYRSAQLALVEIVVVTHRHKHHILPMLLANLHKQADGGVIAEKSMKGSLYLLSNHEFLKTCARNWAYLSELSLALSKCQFVEKISIQKLVENLFKALLRYRPGEYVAPLTLKALDATWVDTTVKEKGLHKITHREQQSHIEHAQLMHALIQLIDSKTLNWRYLGMVYQAMVKLAQPAYVVSKQAAQLAVHGLVSEFKHIREISAEFTTRILTIIKTRSIRQRHGGRNPLKRVLDLPTNLPSDYHTTLQRESDVYVDKALFGTFAWPRSILVYDKPSNDTIMLDAVQNDCAEAYQAISQAINSHAFWKQLANYAAMELDKNTHFSYLSAFVYKTLVQMFGPESLQYQESVFGEMLQDAEQSSKQRAVAEWIAGLARGSKHWGVESSQRAWAVILQSFQRAMTTITPETKSLWMDALGYILIARDPARARTLIDWIFASSKLDVDSNAAFEESVKLNVERAVIKYGKWRVMDRFQDRFDEYMSHVQHPYEQVRRQLGVNISRVIQIKSLALEPAHFSHDLTALLAKATICHDEGLSAHLMHLQTTLSQLGNQVNDPATLVTYANIADTALTILHMILKCQWNQLWPVVCLPLVHSVFDMQDLSTDKELSGYATKVFDLLSKQTPEPQVFSEVFDALLKASTHSGWHIRGRALSYTQVSFVRNVFLATVEQREAFVQLVRASLKDTQLEVRQMAGLALSSILRCSAEPTTIAYTTAFLKGLRKPLPLRVKGQPPTTAYSKAILDRHGNILGLAAVVHTVPYTIPEWLPGVLVKLVQYVGDPEPIRVCFWRCA
jgi:proteasome activator subunit 4